MKVKDAIAYADDVKPNAFGDEVKFRWLTELDGRIAADVFLMAKPELDRLRYVCPDDGEDELLADSPHDGIYPVYLSAMIDFHNGEYEKYQNTMTIFNEMYGNFVRWYARVYAPAQGRRYYHGYV